MPRSQTHSCLCSPAQDQTPCTPPSHRLYTRRPPVQWAAGPVARPTPLQPTCMPIRRTAVGTRNPAHRLHDSSCRHTSATCLSLQPAWISATTPEINLTPRIFNLKHQAPVPNSHTLSRCCLTLQQQQQRWVLQLQQPLHPRCCSSWHSHSGSHAQTQRAQQQGHPPCCPRCCWLRQQTRC
jgi:hypothetical protein